MELAASRAQPRDEGRRRCVNLLGKQATGRAFCSSMETTNGHGGLDGVKLEPSLGGFVIIHSLNVRETQGFEMRRQGR